MNLPPPSAEYLLALAWRSIRRGTGRGGQAGPGPVDVAGAPAAALAERACFVTLATATGELRGCRGVLEAQRPLALDVWHNAWASAFDDPRFPPVGADEVDRLRLEISVLGPLETVAAASEAELRGRLVPGRDGVVLAWRGRRATFLPQVWDSVPDPGDFLAELKRKAGLPAGFWAEDLAVQVYGVEKLLDAGAAAARG